MAPFLVGILVKAISCQQSAVRFKKVKIEYY